MDLCFSRNVQRGAKVGRLRILWENLKDAIVEDFRDRIDLEMDYGAIYLIG